MTHANLLTLLASRALKAGSQARLAAELGVSTGYLNDVLQGRKDPGKGILEPLGLERVVSYCKVKKASRLSPQALPASNTEICA